MGKKGIFRRLAERIQPSIQVGPTGSLTIAVNYREPVSDAAIDERISNLTRTRTELLEAVSAVEQLEREARERKIEVAELRDHVSKLQTDKKTVETVLQIDQGSFARVLSEATRATARRGIIIGIVIGLATGFISSFAVWYFTL